MRISQNVKKCFIVKYSSYYFHVKTKMLADFQICISVPLKHFARSNSVSQIPAIFLKNKARQSKMKTRFSFDGYVVRLYSFSYTRQSRLGCPLKKRISQRRVEEKQNKQLYKTYQSMKITVWCMLIWRGKRRIAYVIRIAL